MTDDQARLVRSDVALTAELDGETVMLDPAKGSYFTIGSVGSRIWELLEHPTTVPDLCRTLEGEFDVEPETCRAEVQKFVDDLTEQGLVNAA